MGRFKYILFLLLFLSSSLFATNVEFKDARKVRIEVLKLYEGYVNAMERLHNISYDYLLEDEFLNLFDANARLYNNIIPTYEPEDGLLSPNEYIDLYSHIRSAGFSFSNFMCDSICNFDDNFYKAFCSFNHRIKTFLVKVDANSGNLVRVGDEHEEINLKELHYPEYEFACKLVIKVPKNNFESSAIEELTVEKPLGKFFVLQNPKSLNFTDYKFSKNGRIFNQDMVKSPYDFCKKENDIFSPLTINQNRLNKNFYTILRKNRNKVEFGIGFSPISFGNSISKKQGFTGINNYSSELSLLGKIGVQIKHNKTNYWFVNFGLQASLFNSRYFGNNYTEYNTIDIDGDKYLRKISLKINKELTNVLSVSLPITFECIIPLKKESFLSVDFGGFIGVNAIAKTRFNIDASYRGMYDIFGGVEFDHYYDYGDFSLTNKNISINKLPINRWNYGAIVGVSYLRKLGTKEDWLWKAGISYKGNFTTNFKPIQNLIISSDYNKYNPIIQLATCPNQGLNLTFSLVKLF